MQNGQKYNALTEQRKHHPKWNETQRENHINKTGKKYRMTVREGRKTWHNKRKSGSTKQIIGKERDVSEETQNEYIEV